jgi:hypothetical protein
VCLVGRGNFGVGRFWLRTAPCLALGLDPSVRVLPGLVPVRNECSRDAEGKGLSVGVQEDSRNAKIKAKGQSTHVKESQGLQCLVATKPVAQQESVWEKRK